jgi:Kef-type K+ transport system membrane component KefB
VRRPNGTVRITAGPAGSGGARVLLCGLIALGALWAGPASAQAPARAQLEGAAVGPPPAEAEPAQADPLYGPPALEPAAPAAPVTGAGPAVVPEENGAAARSTEAIRAILGLVVVFVLAYLGGHPSVQRIERRLRIAHVVTTGLPFVLLGMLMRQPQVGVLSDRIMEHIAPLLPIGLGWIGLAAGFRFDARMFQELPPSTARVVGWTTLLPLALVATMAGLMLVSAGGLTSNGSFARDALLLGSAAVLTGRSSPTFLRDLGADVSSTARMTRVIQLQDLVALVGLLLVSSFFRPPEQSGWQLPGIAWLFVAIGMGGAMGALVYAALSQFRTRAELTTILLGSVCLCAGMASHLRLSPLAVCFLTGVVLSNFPSGWHEQVREGLRRMERPIYLLFLVVVGALWSFGDWQGWVLLGLFVIGRQSGKAIGVHLASGHGQVLDERERRVLAAGPIGALSIAIVVNAQDLYSAASISWIVTAVIGGAFLSEILVQFALARSRAPRVSPLPLP